MCALVTVVQTFALPISASAGAAGFSRALRAIAALLAALAVAAAAYASHGLSGDAQMRLSLAAAFAFGHGVALLVLAGFAVKLRFRVVLLTMLLGLLLFAGSLRSEEHTSELQSIM